DRDIVEWERLDALADRVVFQTRSWLSFVARTQAAEPVVAALVDGDTDMTVGYFTGLVVRRYGVRILGSPFPGWTTSYLGFNLRPQVSRLDALNALRVFAFRDLKCLHLELMDRRIDARTLGDSYGVRIYHGFEINLRADEEQLF